MIRSNRSSLARADGNCRLCRAACNFYRSSLVRVNSRAREEKETAFRERIRRGANTVELLGLQETLRRLGLE